MATAKQKTERQARVSKGKVAGKITPRPETVETAAEITAKTKVRTPGQPSIKSTITGMLADGRSTEEITAVIQEKFPNSAAAAKPTSHISFYRSRMKTAAAKRDAKQEIQDGVAAPREVKKVQAKRGAAKKAEPTE